MNKKKRELEQNELADALGSKLDEIRPYIPKIAIFSAVGVLAVVAIAFYFSTRKSVHESQWREYFVSSRLADSRGMKTVAEIFPNTTVGNLALINAADTDYANGSVNIVKNREDYESQLRQAIENYELALQSSSVDRFASARATYALGYAYEALGRFDEAARMYQEIVDQNANSPEGELASKALARVKDTSLTSIYTAFKDWAPAIETAPGGLSTGSMLPARPDISLPQEMQQPPAFDPGDVSDDEDAGDVAPGSGEADSGNDNQETDSGGQSDGNDGL